VQQAIATALYSIVGGVMYHYIGPDVPSPVISAAQPVFAKAAYIVASLTIVVAGVVNAHVACKCIYLRCFPKIIQERSFKSLGGWVAIVAGCWTFAWIIAESVPSFPYMLGLVSALFSGWFSCKFSRMVAAADDKLTAATRWRERHVLAAYESWKALLEQIEYVLDMPELGCHCDGTLDCKLYILSIYA
jgi:Transmembrane amino acid transporter protein